MTAHRLTDQQIAEHRQALNASLDGPPASNHVWLTGIARFSELLEALEAERAHARQTEARLEEATRHLIDSADVIKDARVAIEGARKDLESRDAEVASLKRDLEHLTKLKGLVGEIDAFIDNDGPRKIWLKNIGDLLSVDVSKMAEVDALVAIHTAVHAIRWPLPPGTYRTRDTATPSVQADVNVIADLGRLEAVRNLGEAVASTYKRCTICGEAWMKCSHFSQGSYGSKEEEKINE